MCFSEKSITFFWQEETIHHFRLRTKVYWVYCYRRHQKTTTTTATSPKLEIRAPFMVVPIFPICPLPRSPLLQATCWFLKVLEERGTPTSASMQRKHPKAPLRPVSGPCGKIDPCQGSFPRVPASETPRIFSVRL